MPLKPDALYYWSPIIDSSVKWVEDLQRLLLTIWYAVLVTFKNVCLVLIWNLPLLLQISLVDRVHALYAATIWRDGNENESDSPVLSGLGFVIKKIVVHTEATRVRESELHYNMEKPTWDVRTLLEVMPILISCF